MLSPGTPAIFGFPGGTEWVVVGLIALLVFGKRLPDVARSMGRSIVEFKKGLKGVRDEIDSASDEDSQKSLPSNNNSANQSGA